MPNQNNNSNNNSTAYFLSPTLTVNLSSNALYLSGYMIFSSASTGYTLAKNNVNTLSWPTTSPTGNGAIWFSGDPYAQINQKTTANLRTNIIALSTSPSSNVAFPTSDTTTITNGVLPLGSVTVTDNNPVFSDFYGSLYIIVRVVTKNASATFASLTNDTTGFGLSLVQSGVPGAPSFYSTNAPIIAARTYLSTSNSPSWTYLSSVTDLISLGAYDVAEIVFSIPSGTQTQDAFLAVNSFQINNLTI